MPYNNSEKKKAADKAYAVVHKEEIAAYSKVWRKQHRVELKEYYYHKRLEIKLETLAHYGINGTCKCCWPGCSVDDLDMLSLDHVANDGHLDRKKTGILGGYQLYVHLRSLGFPEGFQTLCCNHQMKKAILLLRERKGRI